MSEIELDRVIAAAIGKPNPNLSKDWGELYRRVIELEQERDAIVIGGHTCAERARSALAEHSMNADFARTLERERNELKSSFHKQRDNYVRLSAAICGESGVSGDVDPYETASRLRKERDAWKEVAEKLHSLLTADIADWPSLEAFDESQESALHAFDKLKGQK